jgi:hypothetical protein
VKGRGGEVMVLSKVKCSAVQCSEVQWRGAEGSRVE